MATFSDRKLDTRSSTFRQLPQTLLPGRPLEKSRNVGQAVSDLRQTARHGERLHEMTDSLSQDAAPVGAVDFRDVRPI